MRIQQPDGLRETCRGADVVMTEMPWQFPYVQEVTNDETLLNGQKQASSSPSTRGFGTVPVSRCAARQTPLLVTR